MGPRKLVAYARAQQPAERWPAPSTVGDWLLAAGLVRRRRRRRRPSRDGHPLLTRAQAPNDVWTGDFKGEFKTGDGRWCYPLTVVDTDSRYLLAVRSCPAPRTVPVWRTFARLFRWVGLSRVIRSVTASPSRFPISPPRSRA